MTEQQWYIGSDLKFEVTLTATGFSQESDNYDIDFYCEDTHLTFDQDDVKTSDGRFFLPVPRESLPTSGRMRMVITAHVPDEDFSDGFRDEVAVIKLGVLKNPV